MFTWQPEENVRKRREDWLVYSRLWVWNSRQYSPDAPGMPPINTAILAGSFTSWPNLAKKQWNSMLSRESLSTLLPFTIRRIRKCRHIRDPHSHLRHITELPKGRIVKGFEEATLNSSVVRYFSHSHGRISSQVCRKTLCLMLAHNLKELYK